MSAMQKASRLHGALSKGGATFGAWQMLAGTNLARTMAGTGLDWICVDGEHGNISDSQMHESVAAIAATGVSPIVRIPAAEPWMVKRALDTGAHGIVVPLLQTPAEVQRLIYASKFPPRGMRGFGSPFPQSAFPGVNGAVEYLQQANEALVTCIQIETKEALANVEAIAAIRGVDVLFVGPFDLGNNIGYPIVGTMHDELKAAIETVRVAAQKHGKSSGIYCVSGEQAREYADLGFNMICVAADVLSLQNYIKEQLDVAKGSLAHSAYNLAKDAAKKISGPYGK